MGNLAIGKHEGQKVSTDRIQNRESGGAADAAGSMVQAAQPVQVRMQAQVLHASWLNDWGCGCGSAGWRGCWLAGWLLHACMHHIYWLRRGACAVALVLASPPKMVFGGRSAALMHRRS